MSGDNSYALVKPVAGDFNAVVGKVKAALQTQGFGVLSEINVSGTLKKRLDVDHPRTLILGACNPKFAHEALSIDADVSVLLPCNVVVREAAGGGIEVAAFNPQTMASIIDKPEATLIAQQVTDRIQAALNDLS